LAEKKMSACYNKKNPKKHGNKNRKNAEFSIREKKSRERHTQARIRIKLEKSRVTNAGIPPRNGLAGRTPFAYWIILAGAIWRALPDLEDGREGAVLE
jgi:hypothetical protein